jgi:hypothetical protein
MSARIYDDSMSISRPDGRRVSVHKEGWTDGEVMTPHGFVTVYAQGDENNTYHSRLDFIWQGRLYMRNFQKRRLTPRGLVTAAARFADEIVEGQS